MATIIKDEAVRSFFDDAPYQLTTIEGDRFLIRVGDAREGRPVILNLECCCSRIEKAAKFVAGCFEEESNFFEVIQKQCLFNCTKKIRLKYDNISVLIDESSAKEEQIIEKWKSKKEVTEKKQYYIIGVRKLAPFGKFDGVCKVLEASEEDAIARIKAGYDYCECRCFGLYDEKKDTFLLKDAQNYMNFNEMFKLEG